MMKQLVCPICQTVNEVDESAVGCYVLCRNCPHRFYVPVPPLGEDLKNERAPVPSVLPDYKAWERQFKHRGQEVEAIAAELRWQRFVLLALLAVQGVVGALVVLLLSRK